MLRVNSLCRIRPLSPFPVLTLALLVSSFVFSKAAADDPKKDALNADLEKLRGTWVVKSFVIDGDKSGGGERYTFSKNGLTIEVPPGKYDFSPAFFEYEIELDPKADPKVMWEKMPGTSKDDDRTRTYIYRLRGETLEICMGMRNRPKKFDGSYGSHQMLYILEREKADKPKPKGKW